MRDSDIDALSADGAQETKPDLRRLADEETWLYRRGYAAGKADRDALAAAAKAVVLAAKEHTPEIAALNALLAQHAKPAAATDPNITINHPAQAAEPLNALLERIAVEEGQHGPSMVKRLRDSGYVIRAAAATGIDVDLLAVARHYARLLADKP